MLTTFSGLKPVDERCIVKLDRERWKSLDDERSAESAEQSKRSSICRWSFRPSWIIRAVNSMQGRSRDVNTHKSGADSHEVVWKKRRIASC